MQPDFIWRVIEIPLLNPQPWPADGCIMSAQPYIEYQCVAAYFFCRIGQESTMQCNKRAQQHAALLFHGAACDRARHLAFNGPVCDRRGKPGERDISAVKLQHVSSCSASHPGPLRKTQGGEHSQPCLSPAASVSIKAAMTAVPEPGMDADDAPISLAF